MKIIIDIPEDVYTRLFDNGIQGNEIAVDDVCEMARALRLGTPLPNNPTNGDVIKFLFPCLEKYEYEELYTHGIALAGNDNRVTWFANGWWNAPYREG